MKLFLYILFVLWAVYPLSYAEDMANQMTDNEAVEAATPSLDEEQDAEKDTAFDALEGNGAENMSDTITQ
jgi:hypothetical protein